MNYEEIKIHTHIHTNQEYGMEWAVEKNFQHIPGHWEGTGERMTDEMEQRKLQPGRAMEALYVKM